MFARLGVKWVASETNFVWIHTARAEELFEQLLGCGVIVRYFGGDAIRVGIGSPDENDATIAAFDTVFSPQGG